MKAITTEGAFGETRKRSRSDFGIVPQGKWLLALFLLAVVLVGWRWDSLWLSEVERNFIGTWEDGPVDQFRRGSWTFRASGAAQVNWPPSDLALWNVGGEFPQTFSWKVRGSELLLRESYVPLPSTRTPIERIRHWLESFRRPPVVHRLSIQPGSKREIVLLKGIRAEPQVGEYVFLQPPGASWPSPTQKVLQAEGLKHLTKVHDAARN